MITKEADLAKLVAEKQMEGRLKYIEDLHSDEILTSTPYTPINITKDVTHLLPRINAGSKIAVFYTIEWAILLRDEFGVKDITIIVDKQDDAIEMTAQEEGFAYIIHKQGMTMRRFDIALGNPPYNKEGEGSVTIWENFIELALDTADTVAMVVPFSLGRSNKYDRLRGRINDRGLTDYRFLTQKDFPNVTVNTLYFVCDKNADSYTQDVWHSSKTLASIIAKIEDKFGVRYYDSADSLKFKKVKTSTLAGKVATKLNDKGFQLKDGLVDTNSDYYRVFTSYLSNGPKGSHLKAVDIATPGIGLPTGYRQIVVKSETEANNYANYLKTNFSVALHNVTKTGRSIDGPQTRFIPVLDFTRSWTDVDLAQYFGFTPAEVQFINDNEFPQG